MWGSRRRVEQVLKRYDRDELPRIPWLDRLSGAAVQELRAQHQSSSHLRVDSVTGNGLDHGSSQVRTKCSVGHFP